MAALHIINPENRETGRYASTNRYVLWFGACGATYLMVWERSLDDALETCAEWLADNAPGLIEAHDSEHLQELYQEACEELFPGIAESDLEDEQRWEAQEQATADMTYTESGYLTSYEWGIVFDEGADRADVKAWIADLVARHYSDDPAIAVG